MAFEKKSQDPWDRKPETRKAPPVPAPETSKPPESKKGPLGSLRAWNERRRAEKEEARRLPPESCPWCGLEMEQGYLYTGRDKIYWSPGGPDSSTIFLALFSATGFRSTTRDGGPPARPPGSAGTAKKWSSICRRTLFPLQRLIRMMNYERKILNGSALLQIRRDGVQQVR